MAQDQKNTTFEVMLNTRDLDVYQVTAAYTTVDERMFPGWTLLKDEHGMIVAQVRSADVLMIRRQDSNPHMRPRHAKPAGDLNVSESVTPSPAQMTRLAGAMGTAVQRGSI